MLLPGPSTIGRSRNCEVMVADPSVSRNHALITVDGDRITVQDLSSSNGTFVNGNRVENEVVVRSGDEIMVGESRLWLVAEGVEHSTRLVDLGDVAAAVADSAPPTPAPLEGPRSPSTSEALSALEAMPVGEALAQPSPSRERTAPMINNLPPEPPPLPDFLPPAEAPPAPIFAVPPPPPAPPAAAPAAPWQPPAGEALPSLEEIERRLATAQAPAGPEATTGSGIVLPPAGFWRRVGAILCDGLLIGLFSVLASFAGGGPNKGAGVLISSMVSFLAGVLVPVLGWSRWGTTPGKYLLGLYVCDLDGRVGLPFGRALLRFVGYFLSSLALGLGYLMPLFTERKRALHDFVAGTYVGYLKR